MALDTQEETQEFKWSIFKEKSLWDCGDIIASKMCETVTNCNDRHCEILADYCYDIAGETRYTFERIFYNLGIEFKAGLICYYDSVKDAKRGIKKQIKVGRLIRKILPLVQDKRVESISAKFQEKFGEVKYILKAGKDVDSFVEAYTSKVVSRVTPSYQSVDGFYFKSLSSACMQDDTEDKAWGTHPATAYASGDLEIVYLMTSEGKVAARTIIGNNTCTYIYTACDSAKTQILDYLKSKGISPQVNWRGLRLSVVEEGNKWLIPYVDSYSKASQDGDHFVIGSGPIDLQNPSGYLSIQEQCLCDHCEEYYSEGDMREAIGSSGHNISICVSCRDGYYSWSTHMDSNISEGIVSSDIYGNIATDEWFSDNDYVPTENGWAPMTESIEYDGDYYHSTDDRVKEFNGKLYHEDDADFIKTWVEPYKIVETIKSSDIILTGYSWSENPIQDWITARNTVIYTYEEPETKIVLRDNYQLNAKGVPERLPELTLELTE
jgi:hypothetical protein